MYTRTRSTFRDIARPTELISGFSVRLLNCHEKLGYAPWRACAGLWLRNFFYGSSIAPIHQGNTVMDCRRTVKLACNRQWE